METKTINKSIEIKAGRERVWQVLTQQPYVNEAQSIFMTTVKGEFKLGEQVLYLNSSGSGIAGKVTEFKPNVLLKVSIIAEAVNGKPDFENPSSKKWEGCYDQFSFLEKDGITTLLLESTCPAEFDNDFLSSWDKMLAKIKELAEK
jgi:uncharacterized protein YndB with AHSA1/START domain